MEAVKKYSLSVIFVSIIAIFAMSHNAGAVNSVLNLNDYSIASTLRSPNIRCNYADNTSNTTCIFTSSKMLYSIDLSPALPNGFDYKMGDVVEFDLSFYSNSGADTAYLTGVLSTLSSNGNIVLMSVEQVQNNIGSSQQIEYTFVYTFHFTYFVLNNLNSHILGITSSASRPFFYFVGDTPSGSGVKVILTNYLVWRKMNNSSTDQQKEIDATNDAVDDSQTAGGSSSQDAQTGTTGLLSAIGSAVSVISSASPTNCKINGNMGNLDMGQLDLCANPAPAFIQTIGSLILILMCVPLAISLFNRFIALFRSFQS